MVKANQETLLTNSNMWKVINESYQYANSMLSNSDNRISYDFSKVIYFDLYLSISSHSYLEVIELNGMVKDRLSDYPTHKIFLNKKESNYIYHEIKGFLGLDSLAMKNVQISSDGGGSENLPMIKINSHDS